MSDYIHKEDLLKELDKEVEDADDWKTAHEIENVVKYFPTADVVEVVRCKECRHNGSFDTDCPFGWRDERFNLPDDMDFCSYGERKDDE